MSTVLALGIAGYYVQRWDAITQENVESAQTDPVAQREQRIEQAQAIVAAEAARVLAANPDPQVARKEFAQAMREVQAIANEVDRSERENWTAADWVRELDDRRR
jgi:hypothetical protein